MDNQNDSHMQVQLLPTTRKLRSKLPVLAHIVVILSWPAFSKHDAVRTSSGARKDGNMCVESPSANRDPRLGVPDEILRYTPARFCTTNICGDFGSAYSLQLKGIDPVFAHPNPEYRCQSCRSRSDC